MKFGGDALPAGFWPRWLVGYVPAMVVFFFVYESSDSFLLALAAATPVVLVISLLVRFLWPNRGNA